MPNTLKIKAFTYDLNVFGIVLTFFVPRRDVPKINLKI